MARTAILLALLAFFIPCPTWAGDEGVPFPLSNKLTSQQKTIIVNLIKTYNTDAYSIKDELNNLANGRIYYGEFDFNDDGINEVIVYNEGFLNCGTAGCALHIFKNDNHKLINICNISIYTISARIFDTKRNNYRLFYSGRDIMYFDTEINICDVDSEYDD